MNDSLKHRCRAAAELHSCAIEMCEQCRNGSVQMRPSEKGQESPGRKFRGQVGSRSDAESFTCSHAEKVSYPPMGGILCFLLASALSAASGSMRTNRLDNVWEGR